MRALRRLSRECVSSAGPRVGARQSTYTPGDGGGREIESLRGVACDLDAEVCADPFVSYWRHQLASFR